jgi:hypothetical protein
LEPLAKKAPCETEIFGIVVYVNPFYFYYIIKITFSTFPLHRCP